MTEKWGQGKSDLVWGYWLGVQVNQDWVNGLLLYLKPMYFAFLNTTRVFLFRQWPITSIACIFFSLAKFLQPELILILMWGTFFLLLCSILMLETLRCKLMMEVPYKCNILVILMFTSTGCEMVPGWLPALRKTVLVILWGRRVILPY